jgi:class 3 adenylate cyclase
VTEGQAQTFLFADLAGFTALTEAHGDDQAADLATEFFACVRALLAGYGAEEVKTIGDAAMLRCNRADSAVELGLAIVEDVRHHARFPVVRIGMHTGPATERSGDWFGGAVNVAARVSSIAGGDEVLVTAATREAAGALDRVTYRRHGWRRFKNLSVPVEVYRALRTGETSERLPVDPVCRMKVEAGQTVGSLTFEGVEYQFCSLECARAFSEAPAQYVTSGLNAKSD